jgi:hypothetical protein
MAERTILRRSSKKSVLLQEKETLLGTPAEMVVARILPLNDIF